MKYLTLVFSILFFGFSNIKDTPGDFDKRLSDIVYEFKRGIMDEDDCDDQKGEADDLADDIKDALRKNDNYTSSKIIKLKTLKNEAEALEQYIGMVCSSGAYIPSIEDFNLANSRIWGESQKIYL